MKQILSEIFSINKNIKFDKILRISIASCLAVIIAGLVGLKYSATAGVIAFLSTQNTVKETHFDVIIRCLAYALGVVLSYITFTTLGYNVYAFGIFMFLLVTICYCLSWSSVISTSMVVCTHFLTEGHFGVELIANEFLLLIIGVSSTMLLNYLVSNNTKEILRDIEHIEKEISNTFLQMSKYVLIVDNSMLDIKELQALHDHLSRSYEKALINQQNSYWDDSHYYIAYMNTRISQCHTLERIIQSMHKMHKPSFMATELSDYMLELSQTVHWRKDVRLHYIKHTALEKAYETYPTPTTRADINDLAAVHDIINELLYYVDLKVELIESLTESQLNRYWKECE